MKGLEICIPGHQLHAVRQSPVKNKSGEPNSSARQSHPPMS
ncbi:hypothetical protein SynBIOSU31_01959 [Synechococcus sp. BIOS-U3-1]|nr:hypothetical protein SynBIOSU31_01959 [Synechococcus sp. BIOS-U3-1]